MRLKNIDVISATKTAGLIYAGAGVLYAGILAGACITIDLLFDAHLLSVWMIGYLLVLPVGLGLLGAAMGGFLSVLYNFVAGKGGGLIMELE